MAARVGHALTVGMHGDLSKNIVSVRGGDEAHMALTIIVVQCRRVRPERRIWSARPSGEPVSKQKKSAHRARRKPYYVPVYAEEPQGIAVPTFCCKCRCQI